MKHLLLAAAIGFGAMACTDRSKDEPKDQLPPITQTGANTAGCLIDGKVLIPKNGSQNIGGPPAYGLVISRLYGSFRLDVKNYSNNGFLHLFIKNLSDNKTMYTIQQSDGESFEPHSNNSESQLYLVYNNKIFLSSDNAGNIIITKNSYPIISGTFTASLYNKDNASDKVKITDGRFDINVATLNK